MERDRFFMLEALKAARTALENGELPIGAVVVSHDEVVSSAYTMDKSTGRTLAHAELLALDIADRILPFPGRRRDAQLYTTLEPCAMCLGAAMAFFIGEVCYSMKSPFDGAVAVMQQWERPSGHIRAYRVPSIREGILVEECRELFTQYIARHGSGLRVEWAMTLLSTTGTIGSGGAS